MPVSVPPWIARHLAIEEQYEDLPGLTTAVEDALVAAPIDLVSPEDLVLALTSSPGDELEVVSAQAIGTWRSVDFYISGSLQCSVLDPGKNWTAVPTNSVRFLLWAWVTDEKFSPLEWRHDGSYILVRWYSSAGAKRLTASLALAACGMAMPEPSSASPLASSSSSLVEFDSTSLALREQPVYGEIMQAAVRNNSPALRYLYLYRLFEHAYLIDALDKLQASFFADPKRSAKLLSEVVTNEKYAFLALLEASASAAEFEAIADLCEANRVSRANRFLAAVHDSAIADNDLNYPEKWKRGCVLCYKIRCSIVHSGKSSPIFESFADAPQGVLSIIPHLERSAFAMLGIGAI